MPLPVSIRPSLSDDAAFIVSSWLKSFRPGIPQALVDDQHFNRFYRLSISQRIAEDTVLIAHPDGEVDIIAGWAAYRKIEGNLRFDYIYTKNIYRKNKIALRMLTTIITEEQPTEIHYAFHTPAANKLIPVVESVFPKLKIRYKP